MKRFSKKLSIEQLPSQTPRSTKTSLSPEEGDSARHRLCVFGLPSKNKNKCFKIRKDGGRLRAREEREREERERGARERESGGRRATRETRDRRGRRDRKGRRETRERRQMRGNGRDRGERGEPWLHFFT